SYFTSQTRSGRSGSREGSFLGAAASRARLRGEVRSSAGRSLPPCRDLPALAARQTARRVPLRAAGSDQALRAREGVLVGIQRLLSRPQSLRHMLEIDPHTRPRGIAPAHRIDKHVGRLQVLRRLRMALLPALEAGERILPV